MGEYIGRARTVEFFEKSKQVMWHKDDVVATISSDKIPAADVVEVRHGEYIDHIEIGAMNNYLECSVCNWKTVFCALMRDSNYCPNCGAKMDGKGEGE